VHCHCPHCRRLVVQVRNAEGPNFCPECRKLFPVPPPREVPPWVLGIVVFLLAHWQWTCLV